MNILELKVGKTLGPSSWLSVDQSRIDLFADATDDHQWIHVDPERAAAGPFGAPIAHGWLTLSLMAPFTFELLPLEGATIVNYGADRVRFPAPLRVGRRVRANFEIAGVDDLGSGTSQVKVSATIEAEGLAKPVCAAELLLRITVPTPDETGV